MEILPRELQFKCVIDNLSVLELFNLSITCKNLFILWEDEILWKHLYIRDIDPTARKKELQWKKAYTDPIEINVSFSFRNLVTFPNIPRQSIKFNKIDHTNLSNKTSNKMSFKMSNKITVEVKGKAKTTINTNCIGKMMYLALIIKEGINYYKIKECKILKTKKESLEYFPSYLKKEVNAYNIFIISETECSKKIYSNSTVDYKEKEKELFESLEDNMTKDFVKVFRSGLLWHDKHMYYLIRIPVNI